MRPLKRPMFKYGGDVKKQGIMHGMNGLRDGGVATTMADATGYAGGGRAALVGNPIFPRGPDGRAMHSQTYTIGGRTVTLPTNPQYRPQGTMFGGRTMPSSGSGGVTSTNVAKDLSRTQKALKGTKNFYQKGKGFFKSPAFSEKAIFDAGKKYIPQYAKSAARSIGSLATGLGSKFPLATSLIARNPYLYAYKASEVTPVDKKYNISRYRDNLFAPFQSGERAEEMFQKKALRNAEQAANPNNFYRYDPGKYGPRKDHPNYDPEKIRYNPFSKDTGAADTEIPRDAEGNIIRFNDAESMFGLKKLKATPGYSKKDRETKLPGEGDPSNVPDAVIDPPKTQAQIDAETKALEDQKLNKIYSLLGVDRAKRNAAGKALADISRYIDEGGKDTISKKNIGSTLTKGILAFDKRLDKVDQLKEAAGLMMAKGEIEKDIYKEKGNASTQTLNALAKASGKSLKYVANNKLQIANSPAEAKAQLAKLKNSTLTSDSVTAVIQQYADENGIKFQKQYTTDQKNDKVGKGKEYATVVDLVEDLKLDPKGSNDGLYVIGTSIVEVEKGVAKLTG